MVKVIIGLIVVVGIVLVVVYFQGGVSNFDPDQQGRDARKQIKPGMTWQQVVKATDGGPKRYQTILPPAREDGMPKPGAQVKWDRETMESEIKSNTHKLGFIMNFYYSHQTAFDVTFDLKGVVTDIEDARTMADLLDTRKR